MKYADRRVLKTWEDFCDIYSEDDRTIASIISICSIFKKYSKAAYEYAYDMLEAEGLQSAQALYHNLNTLESRAGAQLPFTSINFGLNTTFEGRKVTEWCLKASIEGIGKFHQTPIFPISIFKYKKDVNDREGTPNYDLKKLAITSLCKRIYPNIVNSDWSMNKSDKLPSKYIMLPYFTGGNIVNIRIGEGYSSISIEKVWNDLISIKGTNIISIDDMDYIDLRFTDTIVCIDDSSSMYKDYAIKIDEKMAKINYISRRGDNYGITTDSFGFEISGKHAQYPIPKYDYDTEMASMGCRTLIGLDVNGMGYKKTGRGNITPITINLVKIGIDTGICLGKRKKANIPAFFKQLDKMLKLSEKALLDRFNYICSQDYRSGLFMYVNGTIANSEASLEKGIFESLCHCTNALGYIGLAETCYALFGKYHNQDKKVLEFAVSVIKTIHEYAKDATARNQLNFTAYATPKQHWVAI